MVGIVMKKPHPLLRWLQLSLLSVCMLVTGSIVGWQFAHTEDVCYAVVSDKLKSIPARLRGEKPSAAEKAREDVETRFKQGVDAARKLGSGS